MSYPKIFGELYQELKEKGSNIEMNFIDLDGENDNPDFRRS